MTKRVKVRVISLDNSDETYYYPSDTWVMTNEFYGQLVQAGAIKTCFIELEDLVGVST